MDNKDPLLYGSDDSPIYIENTQNNGYIKNIKLKKALVIFMLFTIVGLGYIGYKVYEINTRAFNVYVDEELIGTVRTEEEAIPVINNIKDTRFERYQSKVIFDKDIKFESTHAKDDEIITKVELREKIESETNFLIKGYSIEIDNEEIGVVKSLKGAEKIIDDIEKSYSKKIDKDSKIKKLEFLEEIEISQKNALIEDISDEKELVEYIKTGEEEIKTHIVEAGESLWTIAEIYDIDIEDLEKVNKGTGSTKFKPGDEVKLVLPKSKLTLETIEEIQYNEEVKYDTIIEKDNNMYKNEKKIKVKGANGNNKVVANEIRHNDVLVKEQMLKEEVDKKPVDEIVVQGTKEILKTVETGTFLMPTKGRISSRYGRRWGRMHQGIDIAAPHGTAIKAADSGTISFAGSKGTYGNMVEVNHENGYKTRYAHCSKIHVKVGQKVDKGQHISNVGNTGRSTGPHLHLEVLKNELHQDPSIYIK